MLPSQMGMSLEEIFNRSFYFTRNFVFRLWFHNKFGMMLHYYKYDILYAKCQVKLNGGKG